jgi:hypothetical protein
MGANSPLAAIGTTVAAGVTWARWKPKAEAPLVSAALEER